MLWLWWECFIRPMALGPHRLGGKVTLRLSSVTTWHFCTWYYHVCSIRKSPRANANCWHASEKKCNKFLLCQHSLQQRSPFHCSAKHQLHEYGCSSASDCCTNTYTAIPLTPSSAFVDVAAIHSTNQTNKRNRNTLQDHELHSSSIEKERINGIPSRRKNGSKWSSSSSSTQTHTHTQMNAHKCIFVMTRLMRWDSLLHYGRLSNGIHTIESWALEKAKMMSKMR